MMTENKILHNQIYHKIKEAKNILLVAHEKPDIDAVASVCSFIELIESINKPYSAFCYNAPAPQFNFIAHIEKIKYNKEALNFKNYDLIIIFDCGGLNRTKLEKEINSKKENQFIIEIDHHIKVDDYADIELRDHTRASTTELVYDFFKANKIKINKNIANCILAGIITDSGSFLYPSTSDKTIKISSEMLKQGANLPKIIDNTWKNKKLNSLKVWGKAMSELKINQKYNFAFTVLEEDDLDGIDEEDLEGIPGFLSNLHGVKALLVLRQEKDGKIKGNLRTSHPDIDVSILAQNLGGGGHAKASGFVLNGKIKKTENSWTII